MFHSLVFVGFHCSKVLISNHWFSFGFHWFSLNNDENQWGPSLVMMRECPCSTKIREGLENPSPPPSRFPLAMGFAPLDPRDFPRASPSGNPSGLGVQNPWPREISQDFPRPSRFPSGFALGKSLGSREILGFGDGFSNPSLLLVEHGYIGVFCWDGHKDKQLYSRIRIANPTYTIGKIRNLTCIGKSET